MGILIALLVAASSVGSPSVPAGGPPPAYVVADGAERRMAIGSYCWEDVCVDAAVMPPGPTVRLDPGELVTFRLAFEPRSVRLYTGGRGRGVRLLPGRAMSYEASGRERYLSLFVRPKGFGDVSYGATAR